MDFSNFEAVGSTNTSIPVKARALKKETTKKKQSKVPVVYDTSAPSKVNSFIRENMPADLHLHKNIWQGCEKCGHATRHILRKKERTIECIPCGFTYNIEVT